MGDDVVEVAGDPRRSSATRRPGLLLAGLLQVAGPLLELREVVAPVERGIPEEDRRRRPSNETHVDPEDLAVVGDDAGGEQRTCGERHGDDHRSPSTGGGQRVEDEEQGEVDRPAGVVTQGVDDEAGRADDQHLHRPAAAERQRGADHHHERAGEHVERRASGSAIPRVTRIATTV